MKTFKTFLLYWGAIALVILAFQTYLFVAETQATNAFVLEMRRQVAAMGQQFR